MRSLRPQAQLDIDTLLRIGMEFLYDKLELQDEELAIQSFFQDQFGITHIYTHRMFAGTEVCFMN